MVLVPQLDPHVPSTADTFEERRTNLIDAIQAYRRLQQQIEEAQSFKDDPSLGVPDDTQIAEWTRQLNAVKDTIRAYINMSPRLAQVAANHNWNVNPDKLGDQGDGGDNQEPAQSGDGSGDNNGDGTNSDKGSGSTEKSKQSDAGGGGSGKGHNYFLPGIKGKDFHVERYNGHTYVTYVIHVKGNRVTMTLRVPDDKLRAYGLKDGEGRALTRHQFRNRNFFGSAQDLLVHGENRHPFRSFIEDISAIYGGTGLLKNKEVMSTVLTAYAEQWSDERLSGALRQTKWAQKTTDYQQSWIIKSEAQKKSDIDAARVSLEQVLREKYGNDWTKYFPNHKELLDKWAEKVARGTLHATGDPGKALTFFDLHMEKKASRIEGTPAWLQAQQAKQAINAEQNRPEDIFEQLRAQTAVSLGYSGKDQSRLDNDTLQRWANQLASGRKSQADFDQYLRSQKQALFPYLDPDQTWQDFASPFKSQAEQLLGTSLGWDDKLFNDFTKTDKDGNPVRDGEVPLSAYDFEKRIRDDHRFWSGRVAKEEGEGLVSLLQQNLLGIT